MRRPQKWSANGRPCGTPQPSCADGKARLLTLLYGCRPHMLPTFTAEALARTHKLSGNLVTNVRMIEYELILARQNRAGEIAHG